MKENNRFNNDEYRTLKLHFIDKRYNWEECKKKIKTEIVEREKSMEENETNYVDNYGRNRDSRRDNFNRNRTPSRNN